MGGMVPNKQKWQYNTHSKENPVNVCLAETDHFGKETLRTHFCVVG